MFSKIINIALVYILCILNFAFLTTPYISILYPFLHFTSFKTLGIIKFLLLCAFFLSSIMLAVWIFDFIFSGSIKYYKRRTRSYKHKLYAKYFPIIDKIYKQIQKQYSISFDILIAQSSQIQAFATASFSQKIVVISTETLTKIELSCKTAQQFELAMSGLLAHEASHLLNKDFLPGALLNINKIATQKLAVFTSMVFTIIFFIMARVPILGSPISLFAKSISNFIKQTLTFFMNNIILKIYRYVSRILTRGLEYRSDKDAAKIFGAESISLCLQILAANSYNSIFSTHPSTKARINSVKSVRQTQDKITQNFITSILNSFSVVIIIVLPFILYKLANPQVIIFYCKEFYTTIMQIFISAKYKINNFVYSIKNLFRI